MGGAIKGVRRRDGTIVEFDKEKITNTIFKTARDRIIAEELSDEVVRTLEQKYAGKIPTLKEIHIVVKKVLNEYQEQWKRLRPRLRPHHISFMLKGIGGFLFFIGCIVTWIAFLAPHIDPTWIKNPHHFWTVGILLVCWGIGIFVLGWGLGAVYRVRFERYLHYSGRRIGKLIVSALILTVVVGVLVTYGPGIWEAIQRGGALTPSEVRKHPSKYLGKEITVEGYYSGMTIPTYNENLELVNITAGVIAEKIPVESLDQILGVEILGNLNVISGEKYKLTGVLEKSVFAQYDPTGLLSIMLKVTKAEPI